MKSRLITCLLAGAVTLSTLQAQAPPQSLFRAMAATDPNRDPNWDFWINRPYTFYYNKDGQIKPMLPNYDRLPYYIQGHATSANDPTNPDVFPEDGWMLVIRDFGTPTAAPAFPYFALYNKYRGIMRFFFLNTYNLANSQYATSVQLFNPSLEQYRSALLTFPAESKCFLKDYDSAQQIYTLSNMTLNGWSHYDFVLSGYDPTLITTTSIDSPGFYLNYLASPQPGQVTPVQPIPWGVFNVDEAPEVTVQVVYHARFGPINPEDGTREVYPVLGGYKATVTKVPGVVINPETGMATQSVKYAFKYETRGPSSFVDATQPLSLQAAPMPSGLTYEVKALLPNPSALKHSDPVQVFYKTVPYRRVDGEPIGWFDPYVN